jgi:hypothetical protein
MTREEYERESDFRKNVQADDAVLEYVLGPLAYPVEWFGHCVDALNAKFPVAFPLAFILVAGALVMLADNL